MVAPYADGATHALSGMGFVAVGQVVGLRWVVTSKPPWLGVDVGSPDSWRDVGRYALGDPTSWTPPRELVHLAQLEYPIPSGITRVGYSLTAGVQVVLTELLGAPWLPAWIDRNPAALAYSNTWWNPAGQPNTVAFTYVVPQGRKLLLTSARVQIVRMGADVSQGNGSASADVTLNGVGIVCRTFSSGSIKLADDRFSGELLLGPGASFIGQYGNSEPTGGHYVQISYGGTMFDA